MINLIIGGVVSYMLIVLVVFYLLKKDLNRDSNKTDDFDYKDWLGVIACAIIFPVGIYVLCEPRDEKENEKND